MTGLLLDGELGDEQRDFAETIRSSADTLLGLVNDMLDFSKIEAGKLDLEVADCDVRRVVEDVADLLAETAHARGLELVTDVEVEVSGALLGDTGRLRQVLLNLVGNAVKFTERGEVVVRARLADATPDAALVRFEVADTGIGIAPEARERLFRPFTQADSSTTRKYGGTGLGLAICQRLVDLMGGQIGVDGAPDAGSTFWFTARLGRAAEREPASPEPASPEPASLAGVRALVVDGNRSTRTILERQLVGWGGDVASVEDGAGALALLTSAAADGRPFDLAILDLHMPGMDGLELARTIKADPTLAPTRLTLLTPIGQRGRAPEARRAGIDATLTKPIHQFRLHEWLTTGPSAPATATELAPRPEPPAHTPSARRIPAGVPVRGRLLVAEDNPVNQKVAGRLLERLGYRADVVTNGAEAVRALERAPYAAVLMDCQMPVMDGYAATAAIRQIEAGRPLGRRTPIIAMTANAMRGDRERCLAAGMDDYLSKPIQLAEVVAVVGHWVAASAMPAAIDHAPAGASPAGASPAGAAPEIAASRSVTDADRSAHSGTDAPLPEAFLADAPSIDERTLAALGDSARGGDPEFLAELIDVFLEDAPARLAALVAAVRGEPDTLVRAAHNFKASCGILGARRMQALCEHLEARGRAGEMGGMTGLAEVLTREHAEVERRLTCERARLPAPVTRALT